MRPRMKKENFRLAKYALSVDTPLSTIAKSHGISRQALSRIVQRACQHLMFSKERLDSGGKQKDLRGLRDSWQLISPF